MKIIDLKTRPVFPYEERENNVLYQADTFKTRLVELGPDGNMPPCDMDMHVMFYVIEGQVTVTVDQQSQDLQEGQLLISKPGQFSMESRHGSRLLGIQIAGGGESP